jgi:tetratricopeptide (TPR) repeat protein
LAELGLVGDMMIGNALHYLGDHVGALRHLDTVVNQPAPSQRSLYADRLMAALVYADILWLRGCPDQAVRCMQQTLDEARSTRNALMHANILIQGPCTIALYVGDLAEAERAVGLLLDYSAKPALNTWNALGRCFQGRLLLARGDFTGLAVLRTALNWLREAGFTFRYAISLGALAEGLAAAGQYAEAHMAIAEALELAESNEEHWCLPELLRIKGEIIRLDGSANAASAAEDCFRQSLDWARRQGTLSWELRAATSLARLCRNGRTAEADDLLSAVYGRFTEGLDTVDLKTAAVLLEEFRMG